MSAVLPGLSLAVLAAVAVLPSGLGAGDVLWQPLPLLAAVYFWASRDDDRLGALAVFMAGLTVDVLGGGGLIGLWALLALLTYLFALVLRPLVSLSFGRHWLSFGAAMIGVHFVHFALATAVAPSYVALWDFAMAALVGFAIYPVVSVILTGLAAIGRRPIIRRVI